MANGYHNMWQILKEICDYHSQSRDGPTSDFFYHFSRLGVPYSLDYFDERCENMTIDFINKIQSPVKTMICCKWESSTLNANFTRDEIEAAIDYLKCKKSPGVDNIPAEFIKSCKDELANDLVDVINYIIEKRNFPDRWTEGILSAVYKGGSKRSVNDFRGITICYKLWKRFLKSLYISEYHF